MGINNVLIHADALVETSTIGSGTRIWRNAHIMPGAVIGQNCNIGENCYIEGHVKIGSGVTIKNNVAIWDNITIEDNVFVGPAAVFTNDSRPRAFNKKKASDLIATHIKAGATIGANATIVCGTTIHEYAFIGAGSVVTKDVHPNNVVFGNPAEYKGLMCRCSEIFTSHQGEYHCKCGKSYYIDNNNITEICDE
jgi:UDP-2-acetamido-3-amino-2,3-dideoxy-glucuronate N-acetyltransferase